MFYKVKNVFSLLLLCLCFTIGNAQSPNIPGDFPDPTVIKVGDIYYTSATSSNWMPAYPILKSKDLKSWEWVTNIFTSLPAWAEHYFWAPELEYENGKVYVYYTAKRRGGALAVGVASADRPEGPYTDHGPLVEQPMGSIDGFPMRDENGKLHLIWKEDGNSKGQPTLMFIQEMSEDRKKLLGTPKEMFRDSESWERKLVEGASILRHNNYFFTIYAAAGCCGSGCTYATGVARARSLHGPWEKYGKNPLLTEEGDWRCQGHGTAFKDRDKYFFLYHGYHKKDGVYVGRQGLLKEFVFTPDNWIEFKDGFIYSEENRSRRIHYADKFSKKQFSPSWNWSVFNQPKSRVKCGTLRLQPAKANEPVFFAQKTYTTNYDVQATIKPRKSTAQSGLGIIGDDKNFIAAVVDNNQVKLIEMRGGKTNVLATQNISRPKNLKIKIVVTGNTGLNFHYAEAGNNFTPLGVANAKGLPPWDRALRAGLISMGAPEQVSIFDDFSLQSQE